MRSSPKLHKYQETFVQQIIDNPAFFGVLAMGLGKTASTLTAVSRLIAEGEVFRVLVVAPKRVAEHTWPAERDIWTPHLTMSVIGGDQKQRVTALMKRTQIHVIGRDNIPWLVETVGKKWPFDMLVIDESSSFKNQTSKRFKAIKKVRKFLDRVVLLTGTPSPNSLLELWSQVYLLDSGARLGRTFTSYRDAFFQSDYMGWKWELRKGSEAEIHRRLADISVSMTSEDHLSLPDRIDNIVSIELSAKAAKRYETLKRDFVLQVSDGTITAANAAVLCGKLQQLATGQIYDNERTVVDVHSEKIETLLEIVEAAQGRPLLVFYQYQHELDLILNRVCNSEPLDVEKFLRGEQSVALAHPASAGHGLNLQSGTNEMVWYSLPWSLELYQQANARLHRQGQKNAVVIHHLIVKETIDEDVMQALADKATTQDRLINALKLRIEP